MIWYLMKYHNSLTPLRNPGEATILLQTGHIIHSTDIIPHVSSISKIFNTLGNASVSEPFSKLNTHSIGQWWKLDLLEMPSRQSNVCTIFHMIMADVTSAHLQKYALGNTNTIWTKVCFKNQNWPNMHIRKATKYDGYDECTLKIPTRWYIWEDCNNFWRGGSQPNGSKEINNYIQFYYSIRRNDGTWCQ